MSEISFFRVTLDYTKAIGQANQLANAAERCAEMNRTLKAQMTEVSANWQGEAAAAMLEKLENWYAENAAIQTELQNAAAQIRSAAEKIKQADDSSAVLIRRT